MILAKTWYKTYDDEFLAIIRTFKMWRYYLEDCKHKVFIFTDHNDFQRFIDTKSLSLSKSAWLKNCQSTIFRLIIVKVKLIKLLMSCHNIFSRVLRKKATF